MPRTTRGSLGSRLLIAAIATLAAVHSVGFARAHSPGPLLETAKLTGYSTGAGAPGDNFGGTAVIAGDNLLVGVPNRAIADCGETGVVLAYLRDGGGWELQQTLIPPASPYADDFGGALDVDGSVLVAGCTSPNGCAYVFGRARSGAWSQVQELEIPASAQLHWFGQAVAVDGGTLVVSAPDEPGTNSDGVVYVFGFSGGLWVEQQRLAASDPSPWSHFGEAVSLDGTTLVVSADLEDPSGAAYIFEQAGDTWVERQRLLPSDPDSATAFGTGVAVDGDLLLVSDPRADGPGYESGVVHSFSRSGEQWTEAQRVTAHDATDYGYFGGSMSLLGTTLFVYGNGAVYVFEREDGSWVERQKLVPSDTTAGSWFGSAIAQTPETAAVGATGDDDGGPEAGAVYTFDRTGEEWHESDKLVGVDGTADDSFGRSVAIWGTTAVVGAPNDEDGVADAGAAYFFERVDGHWQATDKVVAGDGATEERFGWSVAVHGSTALVSAVDEPPCGAVYVLGRNGTTWVERQRMEISTDPACSYFGLTSGLWDDTAVVTVHLDHEWTAVAFDRGASGSWIESERLTAPTGDAPFGSAVALFGGTMAIGSLYDDEAGPNAGAVHLYTRESGIWVHSQKLTPSTPPPNMHFGVEVAMWGDLLAVATETDSVHLFRRTGLSWEEETVLVPPGGHAETFGVALAVSPDRVLVGAPQEDLADTNSGVVYSYTYSDGSWSAAEAYLAADSAPFDLFGSDVASWMDTAVIAAVDEGELGCHAGAAYMYAGSLVFSDGFEVGGTDLWSVISRP